MIIGVLALQGAVAEHIRMLEMAGSEGVPVKKISELEQLDGLIIPGGESTTIGRLMVEYGFIEAIREFAAEGKPVFGTCAGLIIIADEIVGQTNAHLKLMDMKVSRNAFGRQRESFETDLPVIGITEPVRAVFIRAPLITEVGPDVEVLAVYNDQIVAARQGHLLACSFHPELTNDYHLHAYFVAMAEQHKLATTGGE
ncbi:MAG: pyridoxal 5'-phosphate synthase glutaminase subunit PdxT [Paenibacillaceae bacterium]